MISLSSVVRPSDGQISADLDGEAVILDLKSGTYYGLDEVGALVWSLIQEPRKVGEIRDAILETYDVAPAQCERDLLALIDELITAGLVEIRDQANA